MEPNPNHQDLDELVQFVVATLPDSIALRKKRLQAMLALLPEGYFWRAYLIQMQYTLALHEKLVGELSIVTTPEQKQGTHDQAVKPEDGHQ